MEQPGEGDGFAERVKIASYPTREHLRLIFVYLGEGNPPPFPTFPEFETEGEVEPGAQHHGVKAGMAVLTKKFSIGLVCVTVGKPV